MIDYDSFSRCHLTDIFFAFYAGAKELTNIGQYKNSLRSTFRCILIVVRGSPNSASSFLIDIFEDLIFALSISWH